MPQIVKCPGCGKPLWIADPGSGLTTVCSACGTGVEAAAASSASTPPPQPPAQSRRPAPASGGGAILWVAVAGIALLAGAGTWFALTHFGRAASSPEPASEARVSTPAPSGVVPPTPVDAWDTDNRARILAMKVEADRLAADGQLRAALDKYRQLQQIVGEHQPVALDLRRALAEVKTAQDRVVDDLLHAAPGSPSPTAATEPTAGRTADPITAAPAPPTAPMAANVTPPTPKPVEPAAQSPRARGVPRRVQPAVRNGLTDDDIGRAIERGINAILKQFNEGRLRYGLQNDSAFTTGLDALAVYAVLQASLAVKDERLSVRGPLVKSMLGQLKSMKIEGGPETYAHAMRATALGVYNRPEDKQTLIADVQWLLKASHRGGYDYTDKSGVDSWDNSNAQYGLLGVWAGAEAGMEIPLSYWQAVESHWAECQLPDGQWGYRTGPDRSGFAMNCAGIASMFVTHDYLDANKVGTKLGRPAFTKPLEKAMSWMEQGDHSVTLNAGSSPWFVGYNLYGLERVGLASGMKHLGSHDWYRELAQIVVSAQQADGTWRGLGQAMHLADLLLGGEDVSILDQAYVLLFLSRGRHPVMFSKLRFDGPWSNRPRDAANIARYASRELEKPLNWQIVGTQRGWNDWMDSPILYLAGHTAPKLTDTDVDNLRSFVHAGGLIYLNSDGGSPEFTKFSTELGKKLFPAYDMALLPQDHPVYSMVFPMANRPPIRAVSNGARLLMVNTTSDPAFSWQQRGEKARPDAFQFGLNLFVYASGKSDFRNRLMSPVLPEPATPPTHTVPLTRLKYGGNWDPEPGAVPRFSRYLWQQTGWSLELKTEDLASLAPGSTPIAHLTGNVPYTPTPAEVKAIKDYVEAGGVLIIDSCGGSAPFAQSLETYLLPQAFPAQKPQVIDPSHPLLNGKGDGYTELAHPRIRVGQGVPPSPSGVRLFAAGKGHVLYSPLDITSGLLGTSTAGITGFRSEYALPLMKNIILWTEDGQADR